MNKHELQLRATRRARQKKVQAIAFGLIALTVLSVSIGLLISAFSPKTPAPAASWRWAC